MDPTDGVSRQNSSDASDGKGEEEWDTQYCWRLQDELLSSSPPTDLQTALHVDKHDGTNNHNIASKNEAHGDSDLINQDQSEGGACTRQLDSEALRVRLSTHDQQSRPSPSDSTAPSNITEHNGLRPSPRPLTLTKHTSPQGDINGKPKALDASGDVIVVAHLKTCRPKMEDLTQLSSLSPTQENPASVYAHYAFQRSVGSPPAADSLEDKDTEHTHVELGDHDPLLAKHHSTVTDSTAQTYGEHDTGHIHFDDFTIENPPVEDSPDREESLSQDASFAPRREELPFPQPCEPQTPTPPINPFLQKGSVMKGHEMFKATQPSSIGRHMLSATSSRPSPDVYHDFNSPAKWAPPSSPLVRRFEPVESSPLQSSVRTLLHSKSIELPDDGVTPQKSGTQSSEAGPSLSLKVSIREPLQYVSMKESQERRRKETSSSSAPSDTESDSDLDDIPTKRQRERRQREEEIQRQLSAVELHKQTKTSSSPASPMPGEVEVPSTSNGRRRSLQEYYGAQCEGTDALDTQQDDIIADSQSILDKALGFMQGLVTAPSREPEASQNGSTGNGNSNRPASSISARCHDTELELVVDLYSNTNNGDAVNVPNGSSSLPQASLPLKEVSTNRNEIKTPSICKTHVFSDGAEMTVPETSPAEDRIRPLGEIASISFEKNLDELQGLPGFTLDSEFDNAMLPRTSPDPPSRRKGSRHSAVHPAPASTINSEPQGVLNETDGVPAEQQSNASDSAMPPERSMIGSHNDTESMVVGFNTRATIPTPLPITSNEDTAVTVKDHANKQSLNSSSLEPFNISTRKDDLRTKAELKGPSRSLRRSGPDTDLVPLTTPTQPSRAAKITPAIKTNSTPSSKGATILSPAISSSLSSMSTPRTTVTKSSTQELREETPVVPRRRIAAAKTYTKRTLSTVPVERISKRKLTAVDESSVPQRESKRRLVNSTRESSTDPLSLPQPPATAPSQRMQATKLFTKMAFAVSYVNQQEEKHAVATTIEEQEGWILEDGFHTLFEQGSALKSRNRPGNVEELAVSAAARNIGFVALIADEHSRRVKYMQALALGLPCISGKWVSECISKKAIVDWTPYLLCAGRSSFLGNAIRSRTLQPYSATDSTFAEIFAKRVQFLEGKSILAVVGRGSNAEKRQHYLFLLRVLGPSRLEQVSDLKQSRKMLLESEGKRPWDLVYVRDNEKHAEDVIFGQAPTASAGPKKRKKAPALIAAPKPVPEKVRVINDEVVIQSLILGQWLELS